MGFYKYGVPELMSQQDYNEDKQAMCRHYGILKEIFEIIFEIFWDSRLHSIMFEITN